MSDKQIQAIFDKASASVWKRFAKIGCRIGLTNKPSKADLAFCEWAERHAGFESNIAFIYGKGPQKYSGRLKEMLHTLVADQFADKYALYQTMISLENHGEQVWPRSIRSKSCWNVESNMKYATAYLKKEKML